MGPRHLHAARISKAISPQAVRTALDLLATKPTVNSMGRRVHYVSFYRPGFKLTMARTEVRQDNGDLEVPPQLFRRAAQGWESLGWGDLGADRDHPSVAALMKVLLNRRADKPPVFRHPVGTLPIDVRPPQRVAGLGE